MLPNEAVLVKKYLENNHVLGQFEKNLMVFRKLSVRRHLKKSHIDPDNAIATAFEWNKTPEGIDFWTIVSYNWRDSAERKAMNKPFFNYGSTDGIRQYMLWRESAAKAGITLPTKLTLIGTPKIHGTNGGVVLAPDGTVYAQSRNRVLTETDDNEGFNTFVKERSEYFRDDLSYFKRAPGDYVVLYGEYAGKGIKNGKAIQRVDCRLFYGFALAVYNKDLELVEEHNVALTPIPRPDDSENIFYANDTRIGFCVIEVDLEKDDIVKITKDLADEVIELCPLAMHLDVEGKGEGMVFEVYDGKSKNRLFKVKDEKIKPPKAKREKSSNPRYELVNTAIESVMFEWRLEQGLDEIGVTDSNPATKSMFQSYINWLVGDIVKEESNVIADYDITISELTKAAANIARAYFMSTIQENE